MWQKMGAPREKLTGSVENVVYRNEQNDYTVLEIVTEESELVTAVGQMPACSEGECVTLYGTYTVHRDFGRQFSFDSYEKTLPQEMDGILQYLSSGSVRGVGPVTALKIVNRFGADTFEVMENHPEWLADISGITVKKAGEISRSFREQNGIRDAMMFCKDILTPKEIAKAYKRFGAETVGKIKENPFCLCDEEIGIPFEKADRFAGMLGMDPGDKERVFCGILWLLRYNASINGHTCLPREKLLAAAASALGLSPEEISEALDAFLTGKRLVSYRVGESECLMSCQTATEETFIVMKLSELSTENPAFSMRDIASLIEKAEQNFDIRYADAQRDAMFTALRSGVMLLTGGPGTGKTTVVRGLLSIFRSLGMKTVLAAPTGRAAKRMSEATGEEAKTIHRLLETEHTEDGSLRFNRNARTPLEESVIIIDEASMIDLSLTAALLSAVRRNAHLILIGDADQLPSVGAGNVLSDLLNSGKIPTVALNEIFRQSKESLIVTNAHRIHEGKLPLLNVTDNDFFFVRREREADIAPTVASLILERLPRSYGKQIRDGIQIITPSKKGAGGVELLNRELQDKINPKKTFKKEKAAHGVIFREGDRVMQTVNNYEAEWEKNGMVGTGIFNGDIGVIEEISESKGCMNIRFDDRLCEYDFSLLDDLDLAYAITVHKSQGSEYPVVIIPLYSCAPMLLTRNLFYTAVTRAKRMVILVGRSDIPARMVENNREILRYTSLCERMKREF